MSRLGIYADKIEAIREQRGLTPAGFQQNGTDAAREDKEAALAELYRRADSHLPPGIGGAVPEPSAENAPDLETAGAEEDGSTEDEEAP